MNIINLGILAHIDAGKTSVTENLLFACGATEKRGSVDKGDTITDSMDIEKRRGITIRASTTSIVWNGVKCNIIDTPGHMDFIAEVERTFKMLDGAVLILSAKEGIQAQTKLLFKTLQKLQIPTKNVPAVALSIVDLPAPLPPMTVTKSPSCSVTLRPLSAVLALMVPGLKVL